jgi:hypothetical protein
MLRRLRNSMLGRDLRHSMPGKDILPRIIVLYVRIFFDLNM